MLENVKISAVIPTYNRGNIVGRAIESALAQEYPPAEIIVVDDGSIDNTREILESYGEKVRCIYQANAGVSSARNRGVKETKGEWIAFLDADDYWLPGHLGRMVSTIHATGGEAALYFSDLKVPRQEGGGRYWNRCGFEIEGNWEFMRDAGDWAFLPIQPMMVQASVISTKIFVELGGFSEQLRIAEDTLLFFKICLFYPVCAVSGCGTVMNSDDNLRLTQVHHNYSLVYKQAIVFLYKELLASKKELNLERRQFIRNALAAAYYSVFREFLRQRKYWSATRNIALSCHANPLVFAKEFGCTLVRYLNIKADADKSKLYHGGK